VSGPQTPNISASVPHPTQHCFCPRDAIAKVLYALLFGWLIARVNALVSPQQDTLSIAILDIYGFEVGLCVWVRGRGHRDSCLPLPVLPITAPCLPPLH
jgi:hypothetical protein